MPTNNIVSISGSSAREIYDSLTRLLAEKKLHEYISSEEGLNGIVGSFVSAAERSPADALLAAAGLTRLAAVARGREDKVLKAIPEILVEQPPSISTLSDSDERLYAAMAMAHVGEGWVEGYCLTEAIVEDKAPKPRKELLRIALERISRISVFIDELRGRLSPLGQIQSVEARFTRIKRLFEAIDSVISETTVECGENPGDALAAFYIETHRKDIEEAEDSVRFFIAEHALSIMNRIISLSFSLAIKAETYGVLREIRKNMHVARWSVFILKKSEEIHVTRRNLLEGAVILARQETEDAEFAEVIANCYERRVTANNAVIRRFTDLEDLTPSIRQWWESTGKNVTGSQVKTQAFNLSADQVIGRLMIQVNDAEEVMRGVKTSAGILQGYDPIRAHHATKAWNAHVTIRQQVFNLARIRNLSLTGGKGKAGTRYNPRVHEMSGGHQPGIRTVKVVRNGVEKRFAKQTSVLIKELVEPVNKNGNKNG